MISICLTFKDRFSFLKDFFLMLKCQNYDLKKVEICLSIASNSSEKVIVEYLISENYKNFYQINYTESDRSKLPFKVIANPTCDINSQICNQPIFNKIIRTDPEVLFLNSNLLQKVEDDLEEESKCVWFGSLDSVRRLSIIEFYSLFKDKRVHKNIFHCRYLNGFFCVAFNKNKFIEYGGIDEKFIFGFCAEDTFFQWNWSVNYSYELADMSYDVIHNFHGMEHFSNPNLSKLRYEYSVPLMKKYMKEKRFPNLDCPDWKRPEIMTKRKIFKEGMQC